jgi:hypothetical protein
MVQRLKTKQGPKQASGSRRKDPMPETILGRIGVVVQATPIFVFAFAHSALNGGLTLWLATFKTYL